MATSKTFYRYLSKDITTPITTDTLFELDESDIWNISTSPDFSKPSKKKTSSATVNMNINMSRSEFNGSASSLPVNVPDWSKILKQDYTQNRNEHDCDDFEENDGAWGGACDRIPPHEFLARKIGTASFSVHEGFGRTLKGRDLSRVRNAIWEKTGFQD